MTPNNLQNYSGERVVMKLKHYKNSPVKSS